MTVTTTPPLSDATRPATRRRWLIIGGVVLGLAGVAAIVVWTAGRPGRAPYTDPSAHGVITLCRDGEAVTSGRTTDLPLVSAVVGVPGAAGARGSATLFAYQPRTGVSPQEWTGLQLTPSAAYVDTPAVTLTGRDTTLSQFLGGYPALDGGWVQLRLVLGSADARAAATYATADLHVSGTSWRQAGGGHAACPRSSN